MFKQTITSLAVLLLSAAIVIAANPPTTSSGDGNVFFSDAKGKHAKDPVCGMVIMADDKAVTAAHDGKKYYFCSDGCKNSFTARPTDYIDRMAMPANVVSMTPNKKMTVKDPVSGAQIEVDEKTPHQVYKGYDYFFASTKNQAEFSANPGKYATAPMTPTTTMPKEEKGKKKY